jgi:DNA-binding NtrC family response regulator
VVATNQNLEAARNSARFRKDLYYRLCGHHIHILPLRERREDLPVLLGHFLEKAAVNLGKKKPTPPDELVKLLASYHFPGNVRELESMVYNAVSLHTSGKPMDAFKSEIFKTAGAGRGPRRSGRSSRRLAFPDRFTLKRAERLLVVRPYAAPGPVGGRHDAGDHARLNKHEKSAPATEGCSSG